MEIILVKFYIWVFVSKFCANQDINRNRFKKYPNLIKR